MTTPTRTLLGILSVLSTTGTAIAQTPVSTPPAESEQIYFDMNRFSVEFGYMFDINNGLSVDNLLGGTFSVGYSFRETPSCYHSVHFTTGMFYGRQTDNFSYANERYEQRLIPIMAGYTYHQKLTGELSIFAGIEGGFLYSNITHRAFVNGVVMEMSSTKIPVSFGVDLGVSYKFSKRITWDTGIKFQGALGINRDKSWFATEGGLSSESTFASFATIHTGITLTF